MRLHHGSAILHCVMCAVVVFFFGGGGLEYGLHSRAEKCFNHQMFQGKNLLHTNSVFLQSQQYMHYESKNFNTIVCFVIHFKIQ